LRKKQPKIIKARHIGFCFGVKRAISAAEGLIEKKEKTCSLGPIIHNPFVVKELAQKGLKVVSDIKDAKGLCLVIRSHGISPVLKKKAYKYCTRVLDTTCPFVSRSHDIVSRLRKEGYLIAIVGESRHPEVRALIEMAGPETVVITKKSDIRKIGSGRSKLALIAQTTISRDYFIETAKAILSLNNLEFRIFDTICNDVVGRQKEAKVISEKSDVVCVVGGKNSANTKHLADICRKNSALTYHIESADELDLKWFRKARTIGIVSGASTPGYMVEEVTEKIKKYNITRRSKKNAGK
jgi:(E)-4-hydroxy-3-methyl-but-2-enyl pyrophosphate reductase